MAAGLEHTTYVVSRKAEGVVFFATPMKSSTRVHHVQLFSSGSHGRIQFGVAAEPASVCSTALPALTAPLATM